MMENKPDISRPDCTSGNSYHPLRALSGSEFAALGGAGTVFVRKISAKQLASFVPEANAMPEDIILQMIMAADGVPLLIADNKEVVADWLNDNEVIEVLRH